MLTALGEFGIKEITKLLNIIHDTGESPTDLRNSMYIEIPPPPPPPIKGTVECDQHRTISLKSHLTKVMLRMRNKILPEISETQFGFMADKGTIKCHLFLEDPHGEGNWGTKGLVLCPINILVTKYAVGMERDLEHLGAMIPKYVERGVSDCLGTMVHVPT